MKIQKGFTLIELIAAIVLLFAAGSLVLLQKNDIEASNRDGQRKTAVNAMYYHLEKIYYQSNQAYPEQLNKTVLKGISPDLLQDPSGLVVNEARASLRYEPRGCRDGKCQGYELRADLEKEADFIKTSDN